MSNTLQQSQQWLRDVITDEPSAIDAHTLAVRAAGRLDVAQAAQVYRRAYVARMTASLGQMYPAMWRVLGDDGFFALAQQYMDATPPTSHNLDHAALGLPEFIVTASAQHEAFAFLADLARFERLFAEVFHVPPHVALAQAQLAERLAQGDFVYQVAPSARVFAAPYSVYEIWKLRHEAHAQLDPSQWRQPQNLLLCKSQGQVYVWPLPPATATVMMALLHHTRLSEALAAATTAHPDLTEADVSDAITTALRAGMWVG